MTGPDVCARIAQQLDLFLDREMSPREREEISKHVAECPECAREIVSRETFRQRLRGAVRGVEAPPNLVSAIDRRLRPVSRSRRRHTGLMAFAAAALVTVCIAAWQYGRRPAAPTSQDAYLQHVSAGVAQIMRVGLNDHVHCAVFRKYPAQPPSLQHMTALLGPQYADLEAVFAAHLPPGLKVVMAHRCSYRGRRYVHLIARDGARLVSLVIARRGEGEAFESDLRAVASEGGMPIYSSGAGTFSLAGFETPGHLVYLVSDMDQRQNTRFMESIAAQVRDVLNKAESEG
jgi:anti-sigma factor (TIGR02949 family)